MNPASEASSPLLPFKLLVSLIVLSQIVLQWAAPLDRDEKELATLLPRSTFIETLSPRQSIRKFIPSINQYVSVASSWVSVKCLGNRELALRLPSAFFALVFFCFLFCHSERYFSQKESFLIYLHCGANGLAGWYWGAAKGYSSMMLFAGLSFCFARNLARRQERAWLPTDLYFLFFLSATAFSHTFGAIFALILVVSLNLARPKVALPVARHALLLIPIFLLLMFHHQQFLKAYGDLYKAGYANTSHALTTLLGMTRATWAKLGLIAIAAMLAVRLWEKRALVFDVTACFLILTVALFSAALFYFQTRVLFARFFLAFLFPFVLWIAREIDEISSKPVRALFMGLSVFFLGVVPAFEKSQIVTMLTQSHEPFQKFVTETRRALIREGQSPEGACLTYRGDARQIRWLKEIYFPGSESCENSRHQIILGVDVFDRPTKWRPEDGSTQLVHAAPGRWLIRKNSGGQTNLASLRF